MVVLRESSTISKRALLVAILTIIIIVLNFLIIPFATDLYSREQFGTYNLFLSVFAFYELVSGSILKEAHIQFINEGKERNACIHALFCLKSLLNIISIFIFLVIGFLIIKSDMDLTIFSLLLIYHVVFSFAYIFRSAFQARMDAFKMQVPFFVGGLVEVGLRLLTIVFKLPFPFFASTAVFNIAVTFILLVLFARSSISLKNFQTSLIKPYMQYIIPYFFIYMIVIITDNVGVLIFGAIRGPVLLGIYFIIMIHYTTILVFPDSVRGMLFPRITEMITMKEDDKLRDVVSRTEKYMLIFFIIVMYCIFALGKPYLNLLFGPEYIGGYSLLIVSMLIVTVYSSVFIPYETILLSMRKFKEIILDRFIIFVFSCFGWFLFIPFLDSEAIIIGKLIGIIVSTVYVRSRVRKLTGMKFDSRAISISIGSLVYFIPFQIIMMFFPTYRADIIFSILSLVTLIAVFIIILIVTKVIDSTDWIFIKQLLSFKEWKKYLVYEAKNKEN